MDRIAKEEERLALFEEEKSGALESVFNCVEFIAEKIVRYFPDAECPVCCENLIKKLKQKKDPMHPVMTYCQHWVHHKCFDQYVNEPPFLRQCPIDGCEEMLGNPEFKVDHQRVKIRESLYGKEEMHRN